MDIQSDPDMPGVCVFYDFCYTFLYRTVRGCFNSGVQAPVAEIEVQVEHDAVIGGNGFGVSLNGGPKTQLVQRNGTEFPGEADDGVAQIGCRAFQLRDTGWDCSGIVIITVDFVQLEMRHGGVLAETVMQIPGGPCTFRLLLRHDIAQRGRQICLGPCPATANTPPSRIVRARQGASACSVSTEWTMNTANPDIFRKVTNFSRPSIPYILVPMS